MNQTIIESWSHRDGELLIGGEKLTVIASRLGSDSFYLYDRERISQRITQLRTALPAGIGIHYAIKANPYPPLLAHIATQIDGLDIASGGELALASATNIDAQHISFAGPGKRESELELAIKQGILINVESYREADILAKLAHSVGIRPRVALRINPAFELRTAGMRMGGGPRPFGVDEEVAPEMLRHIGQLDLSFEGLHIFSGSQCLHGEEIATAQQQSLALALRLSEHTPAPIRSLNLGGGFGIPYFAGDQALDLAPIGSALADIQAQIKATLGDINLHIELGRYLVGEAGLYVTRILDQKVSRGETFLITAGGMNHHLAASGNLGQVIRKNYPVAIGNRMQSASSEVVNIHGPLCTPLDVLAGKVTLPSAEIGDWVVVFQSGAYGFTASPGAFLSHEACHEILI